MPRKYPNQPNDCIFDLKLHGDEVIVSGGQDHPIVLDIKIQTGIGEHRKSRITFETQTQCERLLPAILRALK